MQAHLLMGVGRRKTSTAVVKAKEGAGAITINRKPLEQYFPLAYERDEAIKPLVVTEMTGRFDLEITTGGGVAGQVDAVKLAIARTLVKFDPSLISRLREHGFLTRDPRMKERKKYGQKGARKRFQWTKR